MRVKTILSEEKLNKVLGVDCYKDIYLIIYKEDFDNFPSRIAISFSYLTLECSVGFGLPINNEFNETKKGIRNIQKYIKDNIQDTCLDEFARLAKHIL